MRCLELPLIHRLCALILTFIQHFCRFLLRLNQPGWYVELLYFLEERHRKITTIILQYPTLQHTVWGCWVKS